MTNQNKLDQDALSLRSVLKSHFSPSLWRALECWLALFLTVAVPTLLTNAQGTSKSTLSRLLNVAVWQDQALWQALHDWQTGQLKTFHQHQRGRTPRLLVRLDLTSIHKTGK